MYAASGSHIDKSDRTAVEESQNGRCRHGKVPMGRKPFEVRAAVGLPAVIRR
jgi:hypothetical protein